jgi:hypothetical protein
LFVCGVVETVGIEPVDVAVICLSAETTLSMDWQEATPTVEINKIKPIEDRSVLDISRVLKNECFK